MNITADYDGMNRASFVISPPFGRAVTLVVTPRRTPRGTRWVVSTPANLGDGFSRHTTYEAACKAALSRAKRYDRAYSTPRRAPAGVAA